MPIRSTTPGRPRTVHPVLAVLLLLLSACGGSTQSGDHAGQANTVYQILPASPTVLVGQSIQLQIVGPWGSDARWSVQPASAGTISASGLFTAGASAQTCTILAVWSQDVRYTATASLGIYPAPAPAASSPSLVMALGQPQTTATGNVANGEVVGEAVPAKVSVSANAVIQVRHGFTPPATAH